MKEFYDFDFNQYIIPSFRVTWNVISGNTFDFSLGTSFDLYVSGQNDQAFDLTSHKNGLQGDYTILYPSYFIGFKIK